MKYDANGRLNPPVIKLPETPDGADGVVYEIDPKTHNFRIEGSLSMLTYLLSAFKYASEYAGMLSGKLTSEELEIPRIATLFAAQTIVVKAGVTPETAHGEMHEFTNTMLKEMTGMYAAAKARENGGGFVDFSSLENFLKTMQQRMNEDESHDPVIDDDSIHEDEESDDEDNEGGGIDEDSYF
jgi:hypothetical protein